MKVQPPKSVEETKVAFHHSNIPWKLYFHILLKITNRDLFCQIVFLSFSVSLPLPLPLWVCCTCEIVYGNGFYYSNLSWQCVNNGELPFWRGKRGANGRREKMSRNERSKKRHKILFVSAQIELVLLKWLTLTRISLATWASANVNFAPSPLKGNPFVLWQKRRERQSRTEKREFLWPNPNIIIIEAPPPPCQPQPFNV